MDAEDPTENNENADEDMTETQATGKMLLRNPH
jgi:hypothetical protein